MSIPPDDRRGRDLFEPLPAGEVAAKGVSFIRRRRKWIVLGCLLPLILALVVGAIAYWFGANYVRSMDVYQEAMIVAKASPAVLAIVGEPMSEGLPREFHYKIEDDRERAQMAIPLSGPKGEGFVVADATRGKTGWIYSQLDFRHEGDPPIVLLSPNSRVLEGTPEGKAPR